MKLQAFQLFNEHHELTEWVVEFNGWARAPYGDQYRAEIKAWCRLAFGKPGLWDHVNMMPPRWSDDITWGRVSFRDRRDLDWFLIRWSS